MLNGCRDGAGLWSVRELELGTRVVPGADWSRGWLDIFAD